MNTRDQLSIFKGSATRTVAVGFFALLLVLMIPPMFMIPIGARYYAGPVGALVGFLAGGISTWAFVICPRLKRSNQGLLTKQTRIRALGGLAGLPLT